MENMPASMLPSLISVLRIPLSLLFLFSNPLIRISAVLMAMLTDVLDGFLARKLSAVSRLGTLIDPISDKIFVVFAFFILLEESSMESWKIASIFSRDIALILFAFYLLVTGKVWAYESKAIFFGKIATSLQLLTLLILCLGYAVPIEMFYLFIVVGALAFVELMSRGS